jgi:1-phosphofructokinase family hexose kinase
MILAIGLSPAWQQIVEVDRLAVGEVNRARRVHWCASGKVLNVGLALHNLGASARLLTLLGGPGGEAIERELQTLGIARRIVPSRTPTRVCTTVLDAAGGTTTELVENAAAPTPEELAEFAAAFAREAREAAVVVLTGSLPAGVAPSFYRDLLAGAGRRAILDIRGPELLSALETRPLLVKPNREELARTVGRDLANDEELLGAVRALREQGAEWVLMTQGRGPALLAGPDGVRAYAPVHVPTINPIGCGDCLAAGVAWAIDRGEPMPDAVRLGIAAAADNAGQLLPARLDAARVGTWAAGVSVERIADR